MKVVLKNQTMHYTRLDETSIKPLACLIPIGLVNRLF
jgi:hypothetical protein